MNAWPSSALQRAAEKGNLRMVERLLRADADMNAPPGLFLTASGARNLNAIQLGASSGSLNVVEMLLLAGADVNAPAAEDGGLTALQAAALHGHSNVVRRLLSNHADINAGPAKNNSYTVRQAVEKSGICDILKFLSKPLGVIEVYIERAQGLPFASCYAQIMISGTEMARTKTAQTGPNAWNTNWDEVLYVPLCHTTTEILIQIIGKSNRGKYHCYLTGVIPVSELVVETGGNLMMRQPLWRTFPGFQTDSTLSCAISFYPCWNPGGISIQPDDDEYLERLKLTPDVKSPRDSMRLTSQDDPAISPQELIKWKNGFVLFSFSDLILTQSPSDTQFQVLLDDLPFPSYSFTIPNIGNSQLKRIGSCFIRDLAHSKITFRMKNLGGLFDQTGRVFASMTESITFLLKKCLVCIHTSL